MFRGKTHSLGISGKLDNRGGLPMYPRSFRCMSFNLKGRKGSRSKHEDPQGRVVTEVVGKPGSIWWLGTQ